MIDDELQKQLVAMAKEIHTQDNAATHEPIFMVQRHRRTYGFDPAYSDDHTVYVTSDDYGEVDLEERKREYAAAMADEDTDEDEKDLGIETYEEWLQRYDKRHDDSEEEKRARYAKFVEMCQEMHFEEWCDNNENYTKTAYQDTWENVQPFFTRKGAEEYLRINGHNLEGKEKPRIYVESAYRNAEWIAIRAKLLSLDTAAHKPVLPGDTMSFEEAVLDACVTSWVPTEGRSPRETLRDLLLQEQAIALDPLVSEAARKLQLDERAKIVAYLERRTALPFVMTAVVHELKTGAYDKDE